MIGHAMATEMIAGHGWRPFVCRSGGITNYWTGYANRQSGEVESFVVVGSNPTLVTEGPVDLE